MIGNAVARLARRLAGSGVAIAIAVSAACSSEDPAAAGSGGGRDSGAVGKGGFNSVDGSARVNPDGGAGLGAAGLGAAGLDEGELDAPSRGGTITFQSLGATGWYPS